MVVALLFGVVITARQGIRLFTLSRSVSALRSRSPAPQGLPAPEDLERRLVELRGAEQGSGGEPPAARTMTGRVAFLRGLLRKRGLEPERFRISETGGEGEYAEFTLRGTITPFLDFLDETARTGGAPAADSLSIRMFPDSSGGTRREAEISLRFGGRTTEGADGGINAGGLRGSALARFFRHSGPVNGPAALTGIPAGEPAEPAAPPQEPVLFVGTLRDTAGREYAYYKEKDSGLIIKRLSETPHGAAPSSNLEVQP
jgi:hypothetical protein